MRERANGAADLSDCDRISRAHQPLTIAPHFVEPERES